MNGLLNLAHLVAEERAMLRKNWGWFVALGVLFVVAGIAALAYSQIATLFVMVFVGWMFLISGILEVAHAIARKGWQGFWLDLFSGIITALAGVFILMHPGTGASVMTIFLGVLFLIGGIFRIGTGIAIKNPYRGWFIFHGAISVILGLMILAGWPYSAVWVIGTLVAIELLMEGFQLISLGMAAKNLPTIGGDEERTTKPAITAG